MAGAGAWSRGGRGPDRGPARRVRPQRLRALRAVSAGSSGGRGAARGPGCGNGRRGGRCRVLAAGGSAGAG
ncbi:MAG: hypothetical protein DLM61_01830 [Pseudonocardiales bacterium]|nr:MAG: hypothetical protein DLM61_01830 [Pseudonocardiales bacterium]